MKTVKFDQYYNESYGHNIVLSYDNDVWNIGTPHITLFTTINLPRTYRSDGNTKLCETGFCRFTNQFHFHHDLYYVVRHVFPYVWTKINHFKLVSFSFIFT